MWLDIGLWDSLVASSGLAAAFVASLYVWKQDGKTRDHPDVIKQRLLSIGVVSALAPLIFYLWPNVTPPDNLKAVVGERGPPLISWLGFSLFGIFPALFIPLVLTLSLFLGPIVVMILSSNSLSDLMGFQSMHNLIIIRNFLVAPFCEELVFRTCVCTLLIAGGWGFSWTVLGSPLLFGIAHLHHLIGMVRARTHSMQQAIFRVGFQLMYTTIFGIYASFLYLRTGQLLSCFLCHSCCNMLGFPDFFWLFRPDHPLRKAVMGTAYVLGLWLFTKFLYTLTDPSLYHSWLHLLYE